MDPVKAFKEETDIRIEDQGKSESLKQAASMFMNESENTKYSYNFSWMGRPIIQYPQDMIAMQEIIWEVRPDLIIETGIAHGGSLVFYASLLELIGEGEIVGIDIDIREHNRREIEKHPMFKRIKMIEGSSISKEVVDQVKDIVKGKLRILVLLDSNHTHDHVMHELNLYAPFVSKNSYLVVFDTIVEDYPKGSIKDRPWDTGNNPKTAVHQFIKENESFIIDHKIDNKLLISVSPNGYLKRIK